jgi:hypothetical protein
MDDLSKFKNRSDEDIFFFWKNLGFLNGLDEEDAKNVSKLMEKMVIYLLNSEGKYSLQIIETLVFPMIRKAYTSGGMNQYYTPERMCDMIENTFIPFTKCVEKWDNMIDSEAEYCRFFSKLFSKNE